MAILKHLQTGVNVPLAARHLIGRSHDCQLQIDVASVSAIHAEFTWDGRVWRVRDRGSTNGTFIAGRRIPSGKPVVLDAGAEISFGAPERQYCFIDGAAPRLIAFGPDHVRVADDDMLCLPSPDEWEAMIFRDIDGRWVIEHADGTRPLKDEERVWVGGRQYSVHLPGGVPATWQGMTQAESVLNEDALDEGVLEFTVSRDGEYVELRLCYGDRVRPIESRAHSMLLLMLARERIADMARPQLPESAHGWLSRDALLQMAELDTDDPQLLNLWVFRARQQFTQMRLRGASKIIERREGTGQLRLGIRNLRIVGDM